MSSWSQLACGSEGSRISMILPDAQCFGCSRVCATVPTASVVHVFPPAHSNKALLSLFCLTQCPKLLPRFRLRRYCLSESFGCGTGTFSATVNARLLLLAVGRSIGGLRLSSRECSSDRLKSKCVDMSDTSLPVLTVWVSIRSSRPRSRCPVRSQVHCGAT